MKPTINETEFAKKLIDDLLAHDFMKAIVGPYNDDGLYFWCRDNEEYCKENGIHVYRGETKACVVSDNLPNWVIKVGFVWTSCNEEDEDYCSDMNYCAVEAENFGRAIDEELDEFFAAIYELCDREDVTFYIQERADPNEEKTSSTCEEYTGTDDNDDYDRLESLFGRSGKLEELFAFIMDWKINDLHSGNFGYTTDGRAKIIDYSGY